MSRAIGSSVCSIDNTETFNNPFSNNFSAENKYYKIQLQNDTNTYELVSFYELSFLMQNDICKQILNNTIDIDNKLNNFNDIFELIKIKQRMIYENDIIFAVKTSDIKNADIVNKSSIISFDTYMKPYYLYDSELINKDLKKINNSTLCMYKNTLTITNSESNYNKNLNFIKYIKLKLINNNIYQMIMVNEDFNIKINKIPVQIDYVT
jgi:hypothetical protein